MNTSILVDSVPPSIAQIRWLLDALPTATLLADGAGIIVHANPRAERILGPLTGCSLADSVAPLDRLLEEGQPLARQRRVAPLGRAGVLIGYRLSRLQTPEGDRFHLMVFQDIAPLRKLEEERDRLLQLAAVGETLPGVLHEIKNPLASITTAVEVLLEEVAEGHVQRELRAVLSEVRRIKLALEGVGLFRSDLRSTRRAAIDAALREAFLVIEPQLKAKGLRRVLRVDPLPPLPLDPAVMRAFLFNLVTNALHACDPGGEVLVSAALRDGVLEFSVADTGCGMSPEVLKSCRSLFFTTKSNGSGIGLALCSSVVERAGGTLDIASAPGRGTTVTLRIPVTGAPGGPASPIKEEA